MEESTNVAVRDKLWSGDDKLRDNTFGISDNKHALRLDIAFVGHYWGVMMELWSICRCFFEIAVECLDFGLVEFKVVHIQGNCLDVIEQERGYVACGEHPGYDPDLWQKKTCRL
jgi:hypothetical protein